jgi:hypothetical protein
MPEIRNIHIHHLIPPARFNFLSLFSHRTKASYEKEF